MTRTFSVHPIQFAPELCEHHPFLHTPMIRGQVLMDILLMSTAIVHIQYLMRFRGLLMMGLIITHQQHITPPMYSIHIQDRGITKRLM